MLSDEEPLLLLLVGEALEGDLALRALRYFRPAHPATRQGCKAGIRSVPDSPAYKMVFRALVDGGRGGNLQADRALQLLLQIQYLPLHELYQVHFLQLQLELLQFDLQFQFL